MQGFSVQLLLVKCECRIVSCLQFFLFRFAAWESGNLSWVSINTVKTLSASVHKTLDGNAGGRAGICSDVEFSPERRDYFFSANEAESAQKSFLLSELPKNLK